MKFDNHGRPIHPGYRRCYRCDRLYDGAQMRWREEQRTLEQKRIKEGQRRRDAEDALLRMPPLRSYTTEQVFALARAFASLLEKAVSLEQMGEIMKRNAVEPKDSGVCHSHDFVDANQIMLDALSALGHKDYDPADEEMTSFINRAWTVARESGFSVVVGK